MRFIRPVGPPPTPSTGPPASPPPQAPRSAPVSASTYAATFWPPAEPGPAATAASAAPNGVPAAPQAAPQAAPASAPPNGYPTEPPRSMMLAGPRPRVAQYPVAPPADPSAASAAATLPPARGMAGPALAAPAAPAGTVDTFLTYAAAALAVLPLPLSLLGLIPGYRIPGLFLAIYTTLLALLALGYVWYVRHQVARLLLGVQGDLYARDEAVARGERALRWRVRPLLVALLPLALVALSVYSLLHYQSLFRDSVGTAVAQQRVALAGTHTAADSAAQLDLAEGEALPRHDGDLRRRLLATGSADTIPNFSRLCLFYLGAFVPAVVGVAFMAVRERMQRELALSELDMILGPAEEGEGA